MRLAIDDPTAKRPRTMMYTNTAYPDNVTNVKVMRRTPADGAVHAKVAQNKLVLFIQATPRTQSQSPV